MVKTAGTKQYADTTENFFYGCSNWPKCDFALWDEPTGEKCPKCGSLMVQAGEKIKCSNKECPNNQLKKA